MLVFIDESGDPGFKVSRGSSPTFVVCLVAFADKDTAALARKAIQGVAEAHRVYPEFKFADSRAAIRDAFFEAVLPIDFCVRAIVVRKELIHSARLKTDKEKFYSFFVKSMLKFDSGRLKDARVILDGSGDRSFRNELSAYLRGHILEMKAAQTLKRMCKQVVGVDRPTEQAINGSDHFRH